MPDRALGFVGGARGTDVSITVMVKVFESMHSSEVDAVSVTV